MTIIEEIQQKIVPLAMIQACIGRWRSAGDRIVFTNGCFDLIHRGHMDYLARAAGLGNRLVIGLNTDRSVSRLKGASRPFLDEASRSMILASFVFTDAVVLFDEDTPLNLIKAVNPDVLVKGDDYAPESIVGYDIVTERGGVVTTIAYLPGYSTSLIVEKIKRG
jgi:D-glycero-beta-D-manno-heptose 1-phosphate adenylyltransferase